MTSPRRRLDEFSLRERRDQGDPRLAPITASALPSVEALAQQGESTVDSCADRFDRDVHPSRDPARRKFVEESERQRRPIGLVEREECVDDGAAQELPLPMLLRRWN